MSKKIKCLLVEPNKLPKEVEIEDKLAVLQHMVSGLIECVYLEHNDDVVLICNDEGKLNNMELNRDIGYDIIAGPFLIVGDNRDERTFKSLSDEQISKYKRIFNEQSIDKVNKFKDLLNRNHHKKNVDYERSR